MASSFQFGMNVFCNQSHFLDHFLFETEFAKSGLQLLIEPYEMEFPIFPFLF